MCLLANFKPGQSVSRRGLGSGLGYKVGRGSALVWPWGLVNVVCVRDECVSAICLPPTSVKQLGSR